MTGSVIVLGAKGRFGRAAVDAFLDAGWRVRAVARSWQGTAGRTDAERITGDAFDPSSLVKLAKGFDVIVNALNAPYPRWARDVPRFTRSVIEAAKDSGATVIIAGNVYNYGADMPERLTEDTPHTPTTRKGRLREEMEQAYASAVDRGVRTVILRAGDFIERENTGNWFDGYIAKNIAKGRVTYPGPLDRIHAWAYLPDMARAMVGLAEKRADLAAFEEICFPGYSPTGRDLVGALERAAGRSLKVTGMPWPLIRLLGLINPLMREVAEMSYLWRTPHGIDGAKLAAALPDFRATPLDTAIAEALGAGCAETSMQPGLSQPA